MGSACSGGGPRRAHRGAHIVTCPKFGGKIHTALTPNGTSSPPEDSDFAKNGYWANNFNDMPSAIVTCWILLIVNNWFIIADGMAVAVSQWSRLYFLGYWCFAVVIILNLFTAFIIDSATKEIQRGDPIEIEEAQMAAVENQIRRFT